MSKFNKNAKQTTGIKLSILMQLLVVSTASCFSSLSHAEEYKVKDYQYGNKWSRSPVQKNKLKDLGSKAAFASSISIGGASGVYLGKYNGIHLIATANHVIVYPGCNMLGLGGLRTSSGLAARFSGGCLATFQELDLAIIPFTVESEADEAKLRPTAVNFAFNEVPQENERLVFVGYGLAGNTKQKLMLSDDEDCRVISKTGDVRLLDDPDTVNPNGYASWQIANSCDISHGDSGAGIFSKKTGNLLALISSGTFPVDRKFQTSAGLNEELQRDPEQAWKMNLSIPAFKMRETIEQQISEGKFEPETVKTLKALLSNKRD